MTNHVRFRLRQLVSIIAVTSVIVPVFNVLTNEASVESAIQGLVDAVLISLLVGGYLLFVREGRARHRFQQLAFTTDLARNSAILLVLFLVGRALGQVVTTLEPANFVTSFGEAHLLVALPFFAVIAITIQFVLQMNRMIGTNVMRYFVTGEYHRPKMEDRIFLFVDLADSTQLAERLGSGPYFELLRRFVDDLTNPVVETRGEIHQYAGDEVVITWPMTQGLRQANCVRCFFAMRDAITRKRTIYERDFGVVPMFRGGLHGGTVTAGELGDIKRQIVFVGDILNTAARLEEYAKRTGSELVASSAVLSRLTLPSGIEATPCGELVLRGKETGVAAWRLTNSSA